MAANAPTTRPAQHHQLLELLTDCVDRMIDHAKDRYGDEPGIMFTDGFHAQTGEPQRWRDFVPSNVARQQNFLRVLDSLTTLTGNERYRRLARAWMDYAMTAIVEPKSHLFHWGGHGCFDLISKKPMFGCHEFKFVFPYYRFLHDVNPWTVERFIEGLWFKHVKDTKRLLYNRHGFYTWWLGRSPSDIETGREQIEPWAWSYSKPKLPIVQTTTHHCAFRSIAVDLMYAAAHQHSFTGDEKPMTWALRLMDQFEGMRHPTTGLMPAQYSHFEPCRARESLRPPLGERDDLNESTMLPRWAIMSSAWTAIGLLALGDDLGSAADPFRDHVTRDLAALSEHIYDRDTGCFLPGARDGSRIEPSDILPDVGYLLPEEFEPIAADGMMFLAYARAYRVTKQQTFFDMAIHLAQSMGWGDGLLPGGTTDFASLARVSPFMENLSPDGPHANLNDACALVGCLELYRVTGQAEHLSLATALGDRLISDYYGDGFFHQRHADQRDGYVLLDDSVLWALTHLVAAQQGCEQDLPAFYAVNSYFDSKIVARRLDAPKGT